MNINEKIDRLRVLVAPDPSSDEVLMELLTQAGDIVLNRRYPLGVPVDATVPEQYASLQIRIALELFSKMGAEGEISHSENGISRTYEAADVSHSLLRQIVPMVGGVM